MSVTQKTHVRLIPLKNLHLDKHVQMRVGINRSAVLDYADLIEEWCNSGGKPDDFPLPPLIVYWQEGSKHYVADGFHRVLAARKMKLDSLPCEVRHGNKRDALLHAASANATHGVRRSNEDKRKAVIGMLTDKEWGKWTVAEIAAHCRVSKTMVGRYKAWMSPSGKFEGEIPRVKRRGTYRGKGLDFRVNGKVPDSSQKDRESKLERELSGDSCPYCGQSLPKKAAKK